MIIFMTRRVINDFFDTIIESRKGVKMPNQSKESNTEDKYQNPFFEATRKVMLASIGAVALAQDEIEEFIGRLIERGELAEKDGRKLMKEVIDKRKKTSKDAEEEVTKRVQEVLDRLSVPTKADIDELGEKISKLTSKVNNLTKGTQD